MITSGQLTASLTALKAFIAYQEPGETVTLGPVRLTALKAFIA
jgi:hypothetical protein